MNDMSEQGGIEVEAAPMTDLVEEWKMRTGIILGVVKMDKLDEGVQENDNVTGVKLVNVRVTVQKTAVVSEEINLMFFAHDALVFAHQLHEAANEEVDTGSGPTPTV